MQDAARGPARAAKYLCPKKYGPVLARKMESAWALGCSVWSIPEIAGGFRAADYKVGTASSMLAQNPDWGRRAEMVDAVMRLTNVFGNALAIQQWVGKVTQPEAYNRVHDAAQRLPLQRVSPKWASLLLRAPAQMLAIAPYLAHLEKALHGDVPTTVSEALMAARSLRLGEVTDREADFVLENPHKGFEACPQVSARDGGYWLTKLEADDPMQLSAGRLVNCCQHLDGAGASCARSAWVEGGAAIYAVYNRTGKIVAQAFAWRSKEGRDLVFDSIEVLSRNEVVVDLFERAAKGIVGRLGIERVLVPAHCSYGATGELAMRAHGGEVDTPQCVFNLPYSDARDGCRVLAKASPAGMPRVEPVEIPHTKPIGLGNVNVLVDGSGVVCEHCDAEVHPDCEICPVCGQNIAEWVEQEEYA